MDLVRFGPGDEQRTQSMLIMMAEVFDEPIDVLGHEYLAGLLARPEFWAVAAIEDGAIVAGITAHALPLTRREASELLIYDVAVRVDRHRRGIGRALMTHLRDLAAASGISLSWVPVDDEDEGALEFYRALGGVPSPVTLFTFS
jgi:aminoglycoside 3-N-acetyltransferase I